MGAVNDAQQNGIGSARFLVVIPFGGLARAGDHADTEQLEELGRHEPRMGDSHVFSRGHRLVLVRTLLAELSESHRELRFRDDSADRFTIDRNSLGTLDNEGVLRGYGSTRGGPPRSRTMWWLMSDFKEGGALACP